MKPYPAGPICTRESLRKDFEALGVRPGDVVLLHSSLKKVGWICGGAQAVILALLDVLGDGTLVVPTQTSDNSDPAQWGNPPVPREWWPIIRESTPAFDPRISPTRLMGAVPEAVRSWPGALRSAHPQTSFAAVGPEAAGITAQHALDCRLGERSPLAKLEKLQAKVLLLGAGFGSCTAFHLAEYRTSFPKTSNSFAAMTEEGRRWLTVDDCAIDGDYFERLGADFEQAHHFQKGQVGAANSSLFSLLDAVAYAQKWIHLNWSSIRAEQADQ